MGDACRGRLKSVDDSAQSAAPYFEQQMHIRCRLEGFNTPWQMHRQALTVLIVPTHRCFGGSERM